MTESQAILLLKAMGFSDVVRLEKAGSSWRGKAIKGYLSYYVAIDRYTRVVAHLDKESREKHVVAAHTAMAQGSL
jgi:Cys-tRNA synthase (O-phospho-L-seryl-tRNA:Cys-tRNA synthase)